MIKNIIFFSLTIALVLSSVFLGYIAQDEIGSLIRDIRDEDVTAPEECNNLTMRETAYCLNDYVNQIFKYKVRDDSENPSLEELKEEGGDCLNWAKFYVQHIEALGFEAKMPLISTGNKTSHAFAIISDKTGYCILDQRKVRCLGLTDSSLKNETKSI